MKFQFYDQAGSGLLVLIMLTMALIASQAQPKMQEVAPAAIAFQLDTGLTVAIERARLAKLQSLSPVIATVQTIPTKVELSLDKTASAVLDVPESEDLPRRDESTGQSTNNTLDD